MSDRWILYPPFSKDFWHAEEHAHVLDMPVPMDTGAPLPEVYASEGTCTVLYRARMAQGVATPGGRGDRKDFGILRFERVSGVLFGGPNDEALHKHRLHGRGLRPYELHEVSNSRWAALTWDYDIPIGDAGPQDRRPQHYILSFHDSTLEVLAEAWTNTDVRDATIGHARSEVLGQVAATSSDRGSHPE